MGDPFLEWDALSWNPGDRPSGDVLVDADANYGPGLIDRRLVAGSLEGTSERVGGRVGGAHDVEQAGRRLGQGAMRPTSHPPYVLEPLGIAARVGGVGRCGASSRRCRLPPRNGRGFVVRQPDSKTP